MEHESQGYTTSGRCSRNNTHKVKKLVKANRNGNSNNRVAENCPPMHCSNLPKSSWSLRKLVITGPQEHKSTVKTMLHSQIIILIITSWIQHKSYLNL